MKPIQYSFFKNNKEIKKDVKEDMQHSWKGAILTVSITKIIPKLIMFILFVLFVFGTFYKKMYSKFQVASWVELEKLNFFQQLFKDLEWTMNAKLQLIIALVVMFLIYVPLKYGCERYFLLSAKTQHADLIEMFSGFKMYFKVLSIELQKIWMILVSLILVYIVIVWNKQNFISSSLLVISAIFFLLGIIKIYYSKMVHKVLADNPEIEADDAFEKSKKLMGNKRIFAYISLNASYYPLYLLSILTLFVLDFKFAACNESANAFFYLDLL